MSAFVGLLLIRIMAVDAAIVSQPPTTEELEFGSGCKEYRDNARQFRAEANATHSPIATALAESMEARVHECDANLPAYAKARRDFDKMAAEAKAAEAASAEASRRAMEEQRIYRERQRAASEARDAEDRNISLAADLIHDSPAELQIALSASICVSSSSRAETLAAVAEEKRMARRVGVVNLASLESLKDDLRSFEKNISETRGRMRDRHLKPLPCASRIVQKIQECHDDKDQPGCETERMRAMVKIVQEE